ncbi:MAG: HlyD family secretion protein [Saprospiraceae bacterium]|jgi:HlyD family secretion protein
MARKKKKSRRWLIIVLVLVLAALLGAYWFKKNAEPKGEEIEVAEVEKRTIKETVSASGRIYPEVEVVISSDVSGEIVNLYVEEGDSVVTGQLLLKIDPEAYLSTVQRGAANLNNAKAQLSSSRAQIETNRAQKMELETQLKQAKRVHDRNRELFKQGVVSQAQFDETLAQVEATQASINSSDAGIRASSENAKAAEFMVASNEASLQELRTNLSRTSIKAPNSGVISSLSVEKGERVVGTAQMAGTEIMRISNLNTMEAQVEVSENDILKVSFGDKVEIEVDAYIDKKFAGTVTEIANSATNVAGTTSATASLNTDQVTNFIVKIRLDPASYASEVASGIQYPFRPGMSASVDIITDVREDVLTVPIQAVTVRLEDEDADEEKYDEVVFTNEADTVRKIKITTGIQDDEYIEITNGVEDGLSVVSGPYSSLSKVLKDGTSIRIKEEDKKKDE